MGKRYYCDYCDRSFVDDIQARKKHLQGSAHIRSYKQHYQKQRGNYLYFSTYVRIRNLVLKDEFLPADLATLIAEEEKKEECYKFINAGFCAFGESCYRSHFTRHELNMFRNQREWIIFELKNFVDGCTNSFFVILRSWRREEILDYEWD